MRVIPNTSMYVRFLWYEYEYLWVLPVGSTSSTLVVVVLLLVEDSSPWYGFAVSQSQPTRAKRTGWGHQINRREASKLDAPILPQTTVVSMISTSDLKYCTVDFVARLLFYNTIALSSPKCLRLQFQYSNIALQRLSASWKVMFWLCDFKRSTVRCM